MNLFLLKSPPKGLYIIMYSYVILANTTLNIYSMTPKLTTAVLITGAAARISQEVAMFDKLRDPKFRGDKALKVSQGDTLLAGFSSGSLNLAAINACFSNVKWLYKKVHR